MRTEPRWVRLEARGAFNFELTARVLARLPEHNGVERYDLEHGVLQRVVRTSSGPKVVTARAAPGGLELDDGSPEARAWAVRAFGLDLEPDGFYAVAARDLVLGKAIVSLNGLRPPLMDFWEAWVAAILGQQITLAFCLQQITAVSHRYGGMVAGRLPDGTPHDFPIHPGPEDILEADEAGLLACKVSRRKTEYLKTVARAYLEGYFDGVLEGSVSEMLEHLRALRGVGLWTARYWLAAVGRLDFLAYGDAGLNGAYRLAYGTLEGIEAWGEALGPTRGWAYYYLIWHTKYFADRAQPGDRNN